MYNPFLDYHLNIKFGHYNYIPLLMQSYNTVPTESTQDASATSEQIGGAQNPAQNLAAAIRPTNDPIDHHSQQVAKQFSAVDGQFLPQYNC